MKISKKIMLMLTVCIVSIGIVGCSSNESTSSSDNNNTEVEQSKENYQIEINKSEDGTFDYATIILNNDFELQQNHIVETYNDFVISQGFESVDIVFEDNNSTKSIRLLGDNYMIEESQNTFIYGDYDEKGMMSNTTTGKITYDNKIVYPYDKFSSETVENTYEENNNTSENSTKEDVQYTRLDEIKQDIDYVLSKELRNQITNTTLENLQVNENLGTDNSEDVIVLVDLSWSTKNLENTTRTMLEMYSDHLAAKLSSQLAEGSEIALFWKAEYTGLDIKHSYYIKNGNAYKQ